MARKSNFSSSMILRKSMTPLQNLSAWSWGGTNTYSNTTFKPRVLSEGPTTTPNGDDM